MNRNNSNSSNGGNQSTTTVTAPFDSLFNGLTQTNFVFIYTCLAIHLAFFILMVIMPDLRKRTLIFINHAVFTSLFYPCCMLSLQYVPVTYPQMCWFFEIFWPFSVYIRMYSVMLIAVHRYLGVFKIDLFKKMNSSYWYLSIPIVFAWLISVTFTLATKYIFKTTYSPTFCLDGIAATYVDSLLYNIFYVVLAMVFPALIIVLIYMLIFGKLKTVSNNLNSNKDRNQSSINKKKVVIFIFINFFFLL